MERANTERNSGLTMDRQRDRQTQAQVQVLSCDFAAKNYVYLLALWTHTQMDMAFYSYKDFNMHK